MFPALKEAREKLDAKRKELAVIFDEAGKDINFDQVTSVKGSSREIATHVRALNDEMTDLAKDVENYEGVERAAKAASGKPEGKAGRESGDGSQDSGGRIPQQKSFGQLFIESKAYSGRKAHTSDLIDVELKSLMTTSDGFTPESTRTGRVVPIVTRRIQVTDLIPQTTTSQSSVKFMEETVMTNTAAEVGEGEQYPEAALHYEERTSIVRKISVFLPVTEEQLEDEPQVKGLIDNRLMYMVKQRLDLQIMAGNGSAPNLAGLLSTSGIKTQARGSDPTPDAIYKAITKVRVEGQAQPSAVVLNPYAWQVVRLLRTADGLYIWGNPSDAGPDRIWGLQVAEAEVLAPATTGVVADFANFTELAVRRGIDVQVSNSHGTYFTEGKLAIRADMRVAFVVYRPAAICSVTGLPVS